MEAAPKLETVRIGLIELANRGYGGAVESRIKNQGWEIKALWGDAAAGESENLAQNLGGGLWASSRAFIPATRRPRKKIMFKGTILDLI